MRTETVCWRFMTSDSLWDLMTASLSFSQLCNETVPSPASRASRLHTAMIESQEAAMTTAESSSI